MIDENTVQYHIPECTEIMFVISSQERDLSVKLLDGTAKLQIGDMQFLLPKGQEYALPLWPCLTPQLKSRTGCDFIIRGNHYVHRAITKVGKICKNLFGVAMRGDSFVFVLEAGIQLQIFVSESASEHDVRLQSIRGTPEVFGYSLDPKYIYTLQPCSSILVNSRDDKSYTVSVYGKTRRIKVSLLEENTLTLMRTVHDRIHRIRLEAIENRYAGPTILVIGPTNVGKTSFCHFLLHKALEKRMRPVYIDLDVRHNSNTIPGAISLVEIEGRHPSNIGFAICDRSVLQFGSMNFDFGNIELYQMLIQRMSDLLARNQTHNDNCHSGAVIEMCGSLCQNIPAIRCVLQSFTVDLLVVMGDSNYFHAVGNFGLKVKESVFIPQPQNIEPRDENWETKFRENTLRKYFYGSVRRPLCSTVFVAKFTDFKIVRIVPVTNNRGSANDSVEFSVQFVPCEPSIEYCILGVSQSASIDVHLPTAEIRYFVCFTRVEVEKGTVTVLSPLLEIFTGKILIMGDIKMIKN